MIICGTGHRPDKLGGYSEENRKKLVEFADRMIIKYEPTLLISGMALGWDQALAEAAARLTLRFHAYVPFPGMHQRWPKESQHLFHALMHSADKIVTCSEEPYAAWKMQVRNERMVNDSDRVLALWNGTTGGTSNCVGYANKVGKPVINVWDEWNAQA